MNEPRKPYTREEHLRRQGWTTQFVASEPRLSEAVELYETTGFEVHLEPVRRGAELEMEGSDGCTACFDGYEDQYKMIYTRPKKEVEEPENDLW
ncbi:MAG: hypothetical protein GTO12_25760 [Proteobacteria bacterium]|nr:hypothetical protein [Pseudomonadota bacterium]